jgi:hypothetical protein
MQTYLRLFLSLKVIFLPFYYFFVICNIGGNLTKMVLGCSHSPPCATPNNNNCTNSYIHLFHPLQPIMRLSHRERKQNATKHKHLHHLIPPHSILYRPSILDLLARSNQSHSILIGPGCYPYYCCGQP